MIGRARRQLPGARRRASNGKPLRRSASVLVLVVSLIGVLPAIAAPGDVLTEYGGDGTHEIPQTGGPHWIGAMAVRPTGEAILTGSSIGAGSGEQSFWVAEVAADGLSRMDAFAIGLAAPHEFGTAISLQPDGSFYVAGERGAVGGSDTDMFVAAFDAAGNLDPDFGLALPGAADGTTVLSAPGTERTTSVFADGSSIVVGGWRDTAGFPGIAARLQPTGAIDPSFGNLGVADLAWTGYESYDLIETTVWPTSGANYLAIGMFSSGEDGGVASMVVSDTGVGAAPQLVFAGAVMAYDSIPLEDGTVAVATQSFSEVLGSVLHLTKVGADGSVVWMAPGVAVGALFGPAVALAELRDGSLAVATSKYEFDGAAEIQPYSVHHYSADGTHFGELVGSLDVGPLIGDSIAYAAGRSAVDGGLLVTSVTNPVDEDSISGDLAVTKFVGDESGRFTDDDGNVHETNIEAIAAKGITKGCNPPQNHRFCPNGNITRGQMAAFLVRALGLTDDGGGDLFVDDNNSIFEADIDKLRTAGITKGCNPPENDRFCPDEPVRRDQMASFMARAFAIGM